MAQYGKSRSSCNYSSGDQVVAEAMSNFMQYVISLLVIAAIAAVDNYLIIETEAGPAPVAMVWIDGSEFNTNATATFTDRDATQDFQSAGFWIDSSPVSRAEFQQFVDTSGYDAAIDVKPSWMPVEAATPNLPRNEPIFALRDDAVDPVDAHSLHYVSSTDALAYCDWKGSELANDEQQDAVVRHTAGNASHTGIALHASQPMSELSGFRCVRLPNHPE